MHIPYFRKLARMAEEDASFALGMVLCPPLFMLLLWNQNRDEAQNLRDEILQRDREEKQKKPEENRPSESPPL